MKKAIMLFVVLAFGQVFSQNAVVGFKKLQEFLPKGEIPGFTRQKPTGETQTVMGMSTSHAEVSYVSEPDSQGVTRDFRASITDATFMPYSITALAMMQQNYESETEDGYEKGMTVREKYPGKVSVRSGDYKSAKLECGVANKFMVVVESPNTDDVALLQKLLDMMPLEDLAKAEPVKK